MALRAELPEPFFTSRFNFFLRPLLNMKCFWNDDNDRKCAGLLSCSRSKLQCVVNACYLYLHRPHFGALVISDKRPFIPADWMIFCWSVPECKQHDQPVQCLTFEFLKAHLLQLYIWPTECICGFHMIITKEQQFISLKRTNRSISVI